MESSNECVLPGLVGVLLLLLLFAGGAGDDGMATVFTIGVDVDVAPLVPIVGVG